MGRSDYGVNGDSLGIENRVTHDRPTFEPELCEIFKDRYHKGIHGILSA
jgi:hypothetical protein